MVVFVFLLASFLCVECSLSFYHHLPHDDNILYSPLSINIGLGMLSEIAINETKSQILNVLKDDTPSKLKQIISEYSVNSEFAVNLANIFLYKNSITIREELADKLMDNYKALLLSENFDNEQIIVKKVNDHVKQATKNQIKEALTEIEPSSLMVFINTIAFDGKWTQPFNKAMNINLTFHGTNGDKEVIFFQEIIDMNYAELPSDTQLIGLKYKGGLKMYIFLPKNIDEFMNNITDAQLESYISSSTEKKYALFLPKFKFNAEYDLKPVLQLMGIEDAFTNSATFSVTDAGNEQIKVSKAKHITTIEVNEEGTKATAITKISLVPLSLLQPNKEIIVNRPFLFIIRDDAKKVNLFIGLVKNIC